MNKPTPNFHLTLVNNVRFLRSPTRDVILQSAQDALDVLAQDHTHNTRRFLFHESNFTPEFYDLSTGLAGELLQKFSNYSVRAAILGSFKHIRSERFREFMTECNRGRQLRFAQVEAEAEVWLAL